MPRVSGRADTVGALLAKREPFTTHGALSAVSEAPMSVGRLPHDWRERYHADADSPGIAYVVLSYATPIAWVRADGQAVVPDESYSRTTSRHQGLVRRWLDEGRG